MRRNGTVDGGLRLVHLGLVIVGFLPAEIDDSEFESSPFGGGFGGLWPDGDALEKEVGHFVLQLSEEKLHRLEPSLEAQLHAGEWMLGSSGDAGTP